MQNVDEDEAVFQAFKKDKFQLTVVLDLDKGMLHDQLVAAIEGGVQYWARVDVGKHLPGWENYFTAKFKVIEIGSRDGAAVQGQVYEMSIDKLKDGLKILNAKYPHHFTDVVQETGDATTGEVLVQCALFGDIIYG